MSTPSLAFGALQRWMQAVITHPGGVENGFAAPEAQAALPVSPASIAEVVPPSSRLSAARRLQVYSDAYFARLAEVLRSEFPGLVHALGEELFTEFAAAYVHARPSQSYTLAQFGAGFADHLAASRPPREDDDPDWADFLIQCARLERVYSEVFDGPGPESGERILPAALQASSPEAFAAAPLIPAPWVRLLRLDFPLHDYLTAVRRGERPELLPPQPTLLVVSRRDFVVRRVAVGPAEFHVLSALQAGRTVGEALASLADAGFDDVEEAAVRGWFSAWTAARYFDAPPRT